MYFNNVRNITNYLHRNPFLFLDVWLDERKNLDSPWPSQQLYNQDYDNHTYDKNILNMKKKSYENSNIQQINKIY